MLRTPNCGTVLSPAIQNAQTSSRLSGNSCPNLWHRPILTLFRGSGLTVIVTQCLNLRPRTPAFDLVNSLPLANWVRTPALGSVNPPRIEPNRYSEPYMTLRSTKPSSRQVCLWVTFESTIRTTCTFPSEAGQTRTTHC